jgi:hypothetical protein
MAVLRKERELMSERIPINKWITDEEENRKCIHEYEPVSNLGVTITEQDRSSVISNIGSYTPPTITEFVRDYLGLWEERVNASNTTDGD